MQNPRKRITFALVIELERHIEILLLDNDCVIVPDLGGFMAHYSEAHYDDSDQMFLPPTRTLRIEDEVNELRQHIENEGYYELNDIGTLRVNEYGNYEFDPCEAGILTPALYGLSSVEMDPLVSLTPALVEAKTKPVKIETAKENVIKEEKAKEEKKLTSLYVENENDDKIHIRVSVLRNIAAAAIAIFAFFLISTPLNNGSHKEMSMLNMNTETLTRILPKTTIQGVAEVKGITAEDLSAKEEKAEKGETAETTKAQNTSNVKQDALYEQQNLPYYTIVLASHVSKKNATAYVETLHKAGFNEAAVFSSHSTTRVIFNQYKSEAEAYNALHEMREYSEFSQAWVYKVEG